MIFLLYLILISQLKDIRRLFQYHGAEHKIVYNFESGLELNVKNAETFSTKHPRCGTSFIFIIMLVTIFTYAIFDTLALFFIDDLTLDGFTGNIFAVFSGMSFAALTLLLRKQKDDSPSDSVLLGNILTLIIGIPVIATDLSLELKPVILVLVLGIFQLGIPYILYTTAIKYVTALDAIIFPIIEPILNPILVFFILGETLGSWSIFGGAMVLGGVILRGLLKK